MSRAFWDGLFAGAVLGVTAFVWFDAWCERRNAAADRLAAERRREVEASLRAELDRTAAALVQRIRRSRARRGEIPELSDADRRHR